MDYPIKCDTCDKVLVTVEHAEEVDAAKSAYACTECLEVAAAVLDNDPSNDPQQPLSTKMQAFIEYMRSLWGS